MNLPGINDISINNILPKDGTIKYIYPFYDTIKSEKLFKEILNETNWSQEQINMFGKVIPLPRLTACYGDPGAKYNYSKINNIPLSWTDTLLAIKKDIEKKLSVKVNSLLINYYRNNEDHVSWHADDEKELGKSPIIASLSLGAVRKFQVKHNTDPEVDIISINAESGSLMIMKDGVQNYWKHRIAKSKILSKERINLTFRQIKSLDF